MRFNVAIRTISLFPDGEAVYNVGGGMVFDSTAEAEYAGMSAEGAVRDGDGAGFDLIETMRWEPDDRLRPASSGISPGSMPRRASSASSYDPQRIGEALKAAVADPAKLLRTRLVAVGGRRRARVHAAISSRCSPSKVWNVRIARIRLDSADPLLRHKTSRREVYMKARAEYQVHQADEMILLNERGEVCEGTITNIFARHRRRRAGHAGACLRACCPACCAPSCSTTRPRQRGRARRQPTLTRRARRCSSAIRCAG